MAPLLSASKGGFTEMLSQFVFAFKGGNLGAPYWRRIIEGYIARIEGKLKRVEV